MLYRSNRRKHRTILAASFILSVIATSSEASAPKQDRNGESNAPLNVAQDRLFVSELSPALRAA